MESHQEKIASDSAEEIQEIIASDLLGGDILHSSPQHNTLPTDEIRIVEGGITDASGMVPLGGSSDVGGTGDAQASADVGATSGAGALGPSEEL